MLQSLQGVESGFRLHNLLLQDLRFMRELTFDVFRIQQQAFSLRKYLMLLFQLSCGTFGLPAQMG